MPIKPNAAPNAFPIQMQLDGGGYKLYPGATLWDYYAASALSGLLANCATNDNDMGFKEFASDAAGYADAMLAEREKRNAAKES